MSLIAYFLLVVVCINLAASFVEPVRKWPFMAADLPHIHPEVPVVPTPSNEPPDDYSFLGGYQNGQLAAVRAWHQRDDAAWYFAARRNLIFNGV
jgi:hypothetical protein